MDLSKHCACIDDGGRKAQFEQARALICFSLNHNYDNVIQSETVLKLTLDLGPAKERRGNAPAPSLFCIAPA
jgi:hypothetical protein